MHILIILLISYYIGILTSLGFGNFHTKKEFLKSLIPFYQFFNRLYIEYKELK